MIDLPPEPPASPQQHIEQKLVDCGVERRSFSVKYEDYLQSIEIVVNDQAKIQASQFACIRAAAGNEIVSFKNGATQLAYNDFVTELVRPEMVTRAKVELEKRGLLVAFPNRASFPDLKRYAEALEAHCGMSPGSALQVGSQDIIFDPPEKNTGFPEFSKRYSCILSLLMYASAKGDATFAFIGNEGFISAPEIAD